MAMNASGCLGVTNRFTPDCPIQWLALTHGLSRVWSLRKAQACRLAALPSATTLPSGAPLSAASSLEQPSLQWQLQPLKGVARTVARTFAESPECNLHRLFLGNHDQHGSPHKSHTRHGRSNGRVCLRNRMDCELPACQPLVPLRPGSLSKAALTCLGVFGCVQRFWK